jgi:hypothetical protein
VRANEVITCGLPWLRLDVVFEHHRLLEEMERLSERYVSHRTNGRGWRSICLHGIGATNTLAATEYGFSSERDAPHRWTEIADMCPASVQFVRRLPLIRLYRVRFMLLEPGGFIAPHLDSNLHKLGPINVAVNQPDGCLFKMEGFGVIPFAAGTAFLIDISNRHALVNASKTPRFHMIIHGSSDEQNPDWAELIERSYRRYGDDHAVQTPRRTNPSLEGDGLLLK